MSPDNNPIFRLEARRTPFGESRLQFKTHGIRLMTRIVLIASGIGAVVGILLFAILHQDYRSYLGSFIPLAWIAGWLVGLWLDVVCISVSANSIRGEFV